MKKKTLIIIIAWIVILYYGITTINGCSPVNKFHGGPCQANQHMVGY